MPVKMYFHCYHSTKMYFHCYHIINKFYTCSTINFYLDVSGLRYYFLLCRMVLFFLLIGCWFLVFVTLDLKNDQQMDKKEDGATFSLILQIRHLLSSLRRLSMTLQSFKWSDLIPLRTQLMHYT